MDNRYLHQVRFLINILNEIKGIDKNFALKGGTAINLFYQNLPRLSIDLDFTYLPIKEREQSFNEIENFLTIIKNNLKHKSFCVRDSNNTCKKLIVSSNFGNIKIEPSFVLRGHLENVEFVELCEKAQEQFETDVYFLCLSKRETYSGKFIAALDRQHPRDLFDMKIFLKQFFAEDADMKRFYELVLIYLLQSNRPISELINPHFSDLKNIFYNQFLGITDMEISLNDLECTRIELAKIVKKNVFREYFDFIISFMNGNPKWKLLKYYDQAKYLPGIKWKLLNVMKMQNDKRMKEIKILENLK